MNIFWEMTPGSVDGVVLPPRRAIISCAVFIAAGGRTRARRALGCFIRSVNKSEIFHCATCFYMMSVEIGILSRLII